MNFPVANSCISQRALPRCRSGKADPRGEEIRSLKIAPGPIPVSLPQIRFWP